MPEPAMPAPRARRLRLPRRPAQLRLPPRTAQLRLPRRTVRLKLTLLYGALFLVCGTALLAVTYFLVEQDLPTALASKSIAASAQAAASGKQVSEVCYTQAVGGATSPVGPI